MIPRRPQRPYALAGAAGLAVASAALLLPGALSGQTAGQTATSGVVRTNVTVPIAKKALGPWKALKLRRGASVGFREDGRGAVLQLQDSGDGGYVAVTRALSPQSAVGGTADINLARQTLKAGGFRSLISVDSAGGRSVQAGVVKLDDGTIRWAVWGKSADGTRSDVAVAKMRAKLRAWHKVQLITRWNRPSGRAVLRVDGIAAAATSVTGLDGVLARRVSVGLGRPSSSSETGLLLVRSASFRAAVGAAAAGGGGAAGGGSGSGGGTGGGTTTPRPRTPAPTVPTPPNPGPISTLPGRELIRADWETGNTSQFSSVQRVATDRIQAVRAPVRQGSYAGRFQVSPGEDPLCPSGNCPALGPRAEVSIETNEKEGDERWYEWSTLVDQSVPSTAAFQVISQWHSRADGRPPVAMFVENDNLLLMVHPHRAAGDQISFVRAWQGPVKRGTWRDIKMHVKWSGSDSIGFIELWIDGARQTFYNGTQTLRIRTLIPGINNYFKQGYYRAASVGGTGVVYHDNFRMSAPG